MKFLISANTDVGTVKSTNQDALTVKTLNTPQGKMAFALLCDGMGGLQKGEVASATVIRAFERWLYESFSKMCNGPITEEELYHEWDNLVKTQNSAIRSYGEENGFQLGTTAVAILLTQTNYYVLNVGDSRAYEITDNVRQLTTDQTLVAREIALGNLSPEEEETDPRRNVLLQCIGASEDVHIEFLVGDTREGAVYMLCSDGFRHEISKDEIYEKLQPDVMFSDESMRLGAAELTELVKQRGERDNISVALVRTF